MSNVQTPFRYDYVGSFLRPEKLKQARRQFDEGKIPYAELKVVEDEAITELIGQPCGSHQNQQSHDTV